MMQSIMYGGNLLAYLPPQVAVIPEMEPALINRGLALEKKGKVRHRHSLPGYDRLMLLVTSKRLSIFDFILGTLIPFKGDVLTAMTVMWSKIVLQDIPNHLVAYGSGIDKYLPEELRGYADLQKCALVCERHDMCAYEGVYRDYLTGSAEKAYRRDKGIVCGHQLPPGLYDGSKLPATISTPTTKAETGHDLHVTWKTVQTKYPWFNEKTLLVAGRLREYAEQRGIIIADGKLEWSICQKLCDEWGTPDSSRFWLREDWLQSQKQHKSPSGFDKEPAREEGSKVVTPFFDETGEQIVGINNLDPDNEEHAQFVADWVVPQAQVDDTTKRYRTILRFLAPSNMELEEFWQHEMGIAV